MNPGNLLEQFMGAGAGALAWQTYRNWQQGKPVETAPVPTAADAAAKADGHVDAGERGRLFEQVEKLGLDAESKDFVFDALNRMPDPATLAASANGIEQASEPGT